MTCTVPSCDEGAAVFVGEDWMPPDKRDITVYPKDKPLQQISFLSSNIDPMIYPILFPWGDLGWKPNMPHQEQHASKK